MMPLLSTTQIMYPDCIGKEQTGSKKREVMYRKTSIGNTHEVISMDTMDHFSERPELKKPGLSGIKNIFKGGKRK